MNSVESENQRKATGMASKKSYTVGAITYNRDFVRASYYDWQPPEGPGHPELMENIFRLLRTSDADKDFLIPKIENKGHNKSDSSTRLREVAENVISAAIGHLMAHRKKFDALTISGFGPFAYEKSGQEHVGRLDNRADPPFSGFSIRDFVAEKMENILPTDQIRVVTDVTSMGIGAYWDIWCRQVHDHKNDVISVCSLIIEQGIGGTVINNHIQPLGDAYHSEIGHILVSDHPDDIPVQACGWHNNCLTAKASSFAISKKRVAAAELLKTTQPKLQSLKEK